VNRKVTVPIGSSTADSLARPHRAHPWRKQRRCDRPGQVVQATRDAPSSSTSV